MPEDGMGPEGRALEDQANGFAGRVEVIEGPSGRRSWPDHVKARIVRESLEPGVTVSEVARRHRMSPQHLTLWRRAAREGRLSVSVECDEKLSGAPFVPLAIDTDRREPVSAVNDRIVIEMNGMVLKLSSETAANRIAEIVFALEARR
ncbi:MAG: transposase [Steroidobacteraceae bacterium]